MTNACRIILVGAITAVATGGACAQSKPANYPARPVKIIVPFTAGGATDIHTRVVGQKLSERIGQQMPVDNKPGAGANIGAKFTAAARPDGYTIMVISSVLTANPTLYAKQHPFDAIKDFTPIVEIGDSPNVLVTRLDTGVKSLGELIALAKSKPDLLNYSNPGAGTAPHIAVEYFKYRAAINITNVPYSGAAPSMQAVLSGATQVGSFSLGSVAQYLSSGRLIGLVHTGRGRLPEFPGVPNMAESGFPNSESATFQVLVGPAGMPKEIVDQLSKAVLAILKRPDVQETLKNTGFGIIGGGPEQLKARIAQEVPMWREMITKANIKTD